MSIFNSVSVRRPRYNKFNLSHERKLSMNMGQLVPILLQEVVPGDKFRVTTESLLRVAPMLAPIMHRINVTTHFFHVPMRLIWTGWEDFITGGENGLDATSWPYMRISETNKAYFVKGRVGDYYGLPITATGSSYANSAKISTLPFRAYTEIWNEYYRDQNLQTPIDFYKGSGEVTDINEINKITQIRFRAWQKDYFTSALPFSQRGGEVSLPMTVNLKPIAQFKDNTGANYSGGNVRTFQHSTTGQLQDTTDLVGGNLETIDSIEATINDLRTSTRLQEWLEKNARAGSRYVEQILSHFGVKSSDQRLQRPEYLGGGIQPVTISEVLNTSATATDPQGNMSGHGISVGSSPRFNRRFEEHGFVIGLMSVLPKPAYMQGIDRMFTRSDKFDYFWPEFAHLGEQPVTKKEVYWNGNEGISAEETFGYVPRYAEYKFSKDIVCGDFRDSLAFWHLGRVFSSLPALNESFIKADPSHRIFSVTDPSIHKIYAQIYNRVDALRLMPYFGTPRL